MHTKVGCKLFSSFLLANVCMCAVERFSCITAWMWHLTQCLCESDACRATNKVANSDIMVRCCTRCAEALQDQGTRRC
jgi:hypothetical protein